MSLLKSLHPSSFLFCLFVAISGCSERSQETTAIAEPIYSKQYRQDSITAIVTLSETNIPTSGRIRLMIDVHAPADTPVELPDIGNAVTPFTVADGYTEAAQTLPNGKQLHRRVWILTPGLPGTTDFQPLEIMAGSQTLTTTPVRVTVESLLPAGTDTFEIKDIAEPITLLPQQEKKRRSIYTIIGTILLLGLFPLFIKLSKRTQSEIVILPHQTAFQALEKLPEDPVEKIHQLNRILRAYIEARFNLPTIGKTLKEIFGVWDSETVGPLDPADMQRMKTMMTESETIRFSNHVPKGFAEELEEFVKNLIEKTKEENDAKL